MNTADPNPQSDKLDPKAQSKMIEPTPALKATESRPESTAETPSNLPPQLIKRVQEFYEELGREEVLAVQEWEKAGREKSTIETKTVPQPAVKALTPDPQAKATEVAPDAPKSVLNPENKAAKPKADSKSVEPQLDDKVTASKPDATAVAPKREYRNKIIFAVSILGIVAALIAAYLFGRERKAQPPVFKPVSSPYESAIYANGIIESDQPSGANVNIYPEVSGPITQVLVREGQQVPAGTLLLTIDDSVQKATTEQLRLQSEASLALLNELKAEPRMETLAIAKSQVVLAESNLKVARDQYDKDRASYDIDPKSISKNLLDTAEDTLNQAASAKDVAQKQYELIKAGAWSYDVANQEKQYEAQKQAYLAANALLAKYAVKAPIEGVVLSLNTTVGSYVSSQGSFDPYTQQFDQLVVMGAPQEHLAVRCYVDEILVSRLPSKWKIHAEMSIRGSYTNKVPLEFVRVQPFVSPKIELSNQRQEQVDLRVLPVIFRFEKQDAPVYPGQLVDVYIGSQ
jgi:HlyD family secretion protein